MYTPVKPQFYYIKVGLSGSKLYRHVFVMVSGIANSVDHDQIAFSEQSYLVYTVCTGHFVVYEILGYLL